MSLSKHCNKYCLNKTAKKGNLHMRTPRIFQGGDDPVAIYNLSLILKLML